MDEGPASFPRGRPVFPALFAEKSVLSPLNGLDTLVRNNLTTYVRAYFWALHPTPWSVGLSLCQDHTVGGWLVAWFFNAEHFFIIIMYKTKLVALTGNRPAAFQGTGRYPPRRAPPSHAGRGRTALF